MIHIKSRVVQIKNCLVQLEYTYTYLFYKFGAFSAILGMKISNILPLQLVRVYGACAKAASVFGARAARLISYPYCLG